jgi:hypothetical protein
MNRNSGMHSNAAGVEQANSATPWDQSLDPRDPGGHCVGIKQWSIHTGYRV